MTGAALVMEAANRPGSEIIHVLDNDSGNYIESRAPDFYIRMDGKDYHLRLPLDVPRRLTAHWRMARRLLRTDKANAVFVDHGRAVVLLYMGAIYRWAPGQHEAVQVGTLRQCRNVLHQAVAVVDGADIYFGEYGSNGGRAAVPVWASRDGGRSWNVVYEFPAGTIKHIHGVYADPFTDDLWVATGDFENECFLLRADRGFERVERFGDGTQAWRTVALLFERERISWVMDSQLERSYLHHMDRATGALTRGQGFPGPVWYAKTLDDGVSLVQTTCEEGPGVQTNAAHLFASRDNDTWIEVARFEKDALPMHYFKSGIIGFADGRQTSRRFAMFGEALRGLEGRAAICSLQWT